MHRLPCDFPFFLSAIVTIVHFFFDDFRFNKTFEKWGLVLPDPENHAAIDVLWQLPSNDVTPRQLWAGDARPNFHGGQFKIAKFVPSPISPT